MILSVGVLYDSVRFLTLVRESPLSEEEFKESFTTVRVASGRRVLELAQAANWVLLSQEGVLKLTKSGMAIEACKSPVEALRFQIRDFILSVRPAWASQIPKGRMETTKYLEPNVRQCFRDAELLGTLDGSVIRWWDSLAKAARGKQEDANLETGREGERLSLEYEKKRTGNNPKWQSIESNLSGYDILSKVEQTDPSKLRIEVKASKDEFAYAMLHLSRNEWSVACSRGKHVFHLWLLSTGPQLRILTPEEVGHHIPEDVGEGEWEYIRIPFSAFAYKDPINTGTVIPPKVCTKSRA